jgi:low temperature requirement protein LtrA
MAGDNQRGALFRQYLPHQRNRVTYAELFFDLVFVFAVTQISHTLLGRFTPLGVLQTTLLFLAVWWVWVYTSWVTNWLDPERTPVRILLFLLMLGGLVLSTSIPKAFESRGLWFAIAYAAMQVGRTAFLLASIPPSQPSLQRNALRMLAWLSASAVFWIAGGIAEGQSRLVLWGVALGIEYLSPAARFWIPKYGASSIEGLDHRRRPYGGAQCGVHHHRARRIHRRHRCDICRSDLDGRNRRRLRVGLYRRSRDVVDLFP